MHQSIWSSDPRSQPQSGHNSLVECTVPKSRKAKGGHAPGQASRRANSACHRTTPSAPYAADRSTSPARRASTQHKVEPDTPLAYNPSRPRPETTAHRLKVIYEDRHILIIDKPAGLLTQPSSERERDTLLERAGRYLTNKRRIASPYVGIVHRIDKLTSGVILLVCSPRALRPFQSLFRKPQNRAILPRRGRRRDQTPQRNNRTTPRGRPRRQPPRRRTRR